MTTALLELNHQDEVANTFTGRRFDGLVPEDQEVFEVTSLGKELTLEQERKVDFTGDLATKMLELPQVPYERPLRNYQVTYLINCMKRETFRPEMVRLTSCVCEEAAHDKPKGTEFRMNGQHTCWALLEAKGYKCSGKVCLVKYRAKTTEDMRLLYASIDRGAARTKANVVTAHLAGTEQFGALAHGDIKLLSEGYSFYKWPLFNERQKHDGDDIAYLMQSADANLVNAICAYFTTFAISSFPWLRRAPVVAAMYTTFEKAVKVSGEFWDCVREGTGFTDKNDARLRLRNALMTCRIGKGGAEGRPSRRQVTKSVVSEEILRWSITAWNAWRRNEPVNKFRVVLSADRPKAK